MKNASPDTGSTSDTVIDTCLRIVSSKVSVVLEDQLTLDVSPFVMVFGWMCHRCQGGRVDVSPFWGCPGGFVPVSG